MNLFSGFFLAYKNSEGNFLMNQFVESSLPLPFDSFFFLKISLHILIQLFISCQNQSTVAQSAEMTVATCSLMSCIWARFPDRFPHYTWTAIVSSLQLCCVMGVCMLWRNLPPALLAQWPGPFIFMCHYGNVGVEWTLNKSQLRKLTLEKKNYHHTHLGHQEHTLRISRKWKNTETGVDILELIWNGSGQTESALDLKAQTSQCCSQTAGARCRTHHVNQHLTAARTMGRLHVVMDHRRLQHRYKSQSWLLWKFCNNVWASEGWIRESVGRE